MNGIRYLRTYLRKELFQVIFFVTNRCNSRCSFCFNWKSLNKLKESELSLKEIQKISQNMPKFPWLMLSGGEPFMRKDLPEIIELFYTNNRINHLTIPTNGILSQTITRVTEEILTRCPKISLTIALSMDNLGTKHDKIRGVPGSFKSMLKTLAALKPLRTENSNLSIKVNSVMASHNYQDIDALIGYVKELGVDMHSIDFIRGDPFDKSAKLPPTKALPGLVEKIKSVYEYYGGYKNISRHSRFFEKLSKAALLRNYDVFYEVVRGEGQVIPCYAGKVNAVIYANGDVGFCEMLKPIGNIRNYGLDFRQLWNSENARDLRSLIKQKRCHCYHPCYVLTRLLFNEKELLKMALK